MIYYPLSVLMLAKIQDILIISSPEYIDNYRRLFASGADLGLKISYAEQPKPEGLAQAFTIGRDFIGGDQVALILGDNIFFGAGIERLLDSASSRKHGATVFQLPGGPSRTIWRGRVRCHGTCDWPGRKAEEAKIASWRSPAFTSMTIRSWNLPTISNPRPAAELEITDLNRIYLEKGQLNVEELSRGFAWLDTGTHDGLMEATEFVHVVQKRQGVQIACLEEISFRNGFISRDKLIERGNFFAKTNYGKYLLVLAETAGAKI